MRRALALVALACTTMVALAFLIPLGLIIRSSVRDQAMTEATRQAVTLAPVLATSTDPTVVGTAMASTPAGQADRLTVHLPDGSTLGHSHAPADQLATAIGRGAAETAVVADGVVLMQPIALDRGRIVVTEVFVPDSDLTHGVGQAWLLLGVVGLVLVAGSVLVADRLAARVVRSSAQLATAATALGDGDLSVRVHSEGPRELELAARAFNRMGSRIRQLMANEREMIADLSHRLRTPLTALRLAADGLGRNARADQVMQAVDRLEHEVDRMITSARRSAVAATEPPRCDAAAVMRDRLAFWSALAEDQGRPWALRGATQRTDVPVSSSELTAALDALVGNIFRYTPQGTAFAVTLMSRDGVVGLVVEDAGRGFIRSATHEPGHALGSTGLGLDIARRLAESTGGGISLGRSAAGGALVRMWLCQEQVKSKQGGRAAGRAARAAATRERSRLRTVLRRLSGAPQPPVLTRVPLTEEDPSAVTGPLHLTDS